ncbi:hypothetical protein AQUCO_02600341v1 [Aquilegia coerulea]|uniref:Fungal lipase-type domain-containing protein n=1 Tax=Aquilegia coerulea TaxID=218851 RepID=A0A2G5D8H8_AQUCA|nr:hypothetical protein AQUCO_02600341v1 [Aquilegia coerulea]
MGFSSSNDDDRYVIYRPQKLSFSHIFRALVSGKSLFDSEIIETNGICVHETKDGNVAGDKESADYGSIIAHIDERTDLSKTSSAIPMDSTVSKMNILDLSMMAAKIAYENKAYVTNVVTNHWKFHFCVLTINQTQLDLINRNNLPSFILISVYLNKKETQAFICCDRKDNARLIVVVFRGTELFNTKLFNAYDWATDVELSWMFLGKMGRVHLSFMKALGLQDERDCQKGWRKNYTGPHELAYYTIRDELKTLLLQNQGAKIIVTGHSLGGALAILFPSILALHQEVDIISSLQGVYTFGQPRVGDKDFGEYMKANLDVIAKSYYRVVFRYDIVPRIPFDDQFSQFAHFGRCVYYHSCYKGKVLKEEPSKNYFSISYMPSQYLNAWLDLFRAVFSHIILGREFKEGWISIFYRLIGLLIPGVASHSPRDYVNGARPDGSKN